MSRAEIVIAPAVAQGRPVRRAPPPIRTRGDVYADGDALADALLIAREAARTRRMLGGYCNACRRDECPATCTTGQLLAWLARLDDERPEGP